MDPSSASRHAVGTKLALAEFLYDNIISPRDGQERFIRRYRMTCASTTDTRKFVPRNDGPNGSRSSTGSMILGIWYQDKFVVDPRAQVIELEICVPVDGVSEIWTEIVTFEQGTQYLVDCTAVARAPDPEVLRRDPSVMAAARRAQAVLVTTQATQGEYPAPLQTPSVGGQVSGINSVGGDGHGELGAKRKSHSESAAKKRPKVVTVAGPLDSVPRYAMSKISIQQHASGTNPLSPSEEACMYVFVACVEHLHATNITPLGMPTNLLCAKGFSKLKPRSSYGVEEWILRWNTFCVGPFVGQACDANTIRQRITNLKNAGVT